jgi:large subunit ribosomal protein L30
MSKAGSKQIKVTLERSIYGQLDNIVKSVRGLGLRRRHQTVTVADTPENRGMVRTARHLVSVSEA